MAKHKPENYKYCSYPEEGRILEYYKGTFDSVYIILHPFLKPKDLKFDKTPKPSKLEIIADCKAVTWQEILELSGLSNISELDVALRTGILGLSEKAENKSNANLIYECCQNHGITEPYEGYFSPLIENRLLKAIKQLGYENAIAYNILPDSDTLYSIGELMNREETYSENGIFTEDRELLICSHWDSHCSFLCSNKAMIEKVLSLEPLEGFFCTSKTEVYWGLHEI